MKVLFHHSLPFFLTHGGTQTQIEQTKKGLEELGVEVEYLRWWDESQRGDVLHYFGRPTPHLVALAQKNGMKVVMLDLLSKQGSRSQLRQLLHRVAIRLLRVVLPAGLAAVLTSEVYLMADACLANTAWEAHLMTFVFGAPAGRVHVVPNGVEEIFFNSPNKERGQWLVCTATITPRKRVLELARSAVEAGTPLWVIGTPYSVEEPYHREFLDLVQKNLATLRYHGGVGDRGELAAIYRQARGFVLLSAMETRSLSSEEAAASGCPLFLSDLPWARSVFGAGATYCPVSGSTGQTAQELRKFYDAAPSSPPPPKPKKWLEVAGEFLAVYRKALGETAGAV